MKIKTTNQDIVNFDNLGDNFCKYFINTLPLSLVRVNLNKLNEKISINTFEEGPINHEKYVVDENDNIFYKRITNLRTKNEIEHYEGLLQTIKNPLIINTHGEYISFDYSTVTTKFENVIFRHCDGDNILYTKSYTNEEIDFLLDNCPDHPVIQMMNLTFKTLEDSQMQSQKLPTTEEPGLINQ